MHKQLNAGANLLVNLIRGNLPSKMYHLEWRDSDSAWILEVGHGGGGRAVYQIKGHQFLYS